MLIFLMVVATILSLILIGELSHTRVGTSSSLVKFFIVAVSGAFFSFVPYIVHSVLPVFLFTVFFGSFSFFARKFEVFSFIRDEEINQTYGMYFYPWVMFVMFYVQHIFQEPILFTIPMLLMSTCDSFAFLVGRHIPWKTYHIGGNTKTLSGSLAYASCAMAATTVMLALHSTLPIDAILPYALGFTLFTTAVEGVSPAGFDNITVPFSAMAVLYILIPYLSII